MRLVSLKTILFHCVASSVTLKPFLMAWWSISHLCHPFITVCVILLYGNIFAHGMSLQNEADLSDYALQELLYGADDSGNVIHQQIKRLNPNSFSFNRGRRTHEISDFDFSKRLLQSSFAFNRGKEPYSLTEDAFPVRAALLSNLHNKRGPPSGFSGMRGKRSYYFGDDSESNDLLPVKRQPPKGYVVVRGKRVPPSGFAGLRGKKIPPSGFSALRGRKRAPPSGFSGLRGRKRAPPSGFPGLRGRKRAPPSGFSGLRGKKAIDSELMASLSKKSPPDGFLGLRGKKAVQSYFDSINQQGDSLEQDDVVSPGNGLEYYMQRLNYLMQLKASESPSEAPPTDAVDDDKSDEPWQRGGSLD